MSIGNVATPFKAELSAGFRRGRLSVRASFLVLMLLGFVVPEPTYTQVLYSRLSGKVADHKVRAVQGVKVEAVNGGTRSNMLTVTDRNGWYEFNVVQPGTRLTFSSDSFKPQIQQNIRVDSNSNRRIDAASDVADDDKTVVFKYDQSVAFDLREESAKDHNGVTIREVNYAAYTPQRGRVNAYLVQPAGKGPFAGVLFFHWYGAPNGNRNQFLDEAVSLAKDGVSSFLIQGYFPWAVPPSDANTDRQRVIDETIEVRRALDLLLSQPKVDRNRIGYVGHDYGAMYGAITAGVDKRVKTYILIAGIGSFSNWSLDYWLKAIPAADKEAYRKALKPIDPSTQIARAAPATLLFQFANSDEHITKEGAVAFSGAATGPKQIKWYDGKHELHVEAARDDRRAWLTQKLKLTKRNQR